MTTTEKVAYLKGLCEGMGIGEDSREGKLFKIISEILEDLAQEQKDTKDSMEDLLECMEEVSDDLAELEDEFYKCSCPDCEGDCSCCEEEEDDDPSFYSVECPGCGFRVTVDEDILQSGSFDCPECGETIDFGRCQVEEVDFEDEDEEDDD